MEFLLALVFQCFRSLINGPQFIEAGHWRHFRSIRACGEPPAYRYDRIIAPYSPGSEVMHCDGEIGGFRYSFLSVLIFH